MRIEVLVGDEGPVFYNLNKPKMIVGSDMACDVIITHPDVSRQHLIILNEEEQFAVMDRGSTNGTYLNEERLIPGRRVEFNSFFPVRLGTQILISLVSDEDSLEEQQEAKKIEIPIPKSLQTSAPANSDATRVVSLKDLKQAKTETLVKKRAETKKVTGSGTNGKGVKAPVKKKKKGFKMTAAHWAALAVVLTAGYFNNPFKKKEVAPVVVEEKVQLDQDGSIINVKKKVDNELKFFENQVYSMAVIKTLYEQPKCSSALEKKLCEELKTIPSAPYGVIEDSDKRLIYYIDAKDLYVEAQRLYMPISVRALYADPNATLTPEQAAAKEKAESATVNIPRDDYWYVTMTLYFSEVFGIKPDADILSREFVMVFYDDDSGNARAVITSNGNKIFRFLNSTDRNRFTALDTKGINSIGYAREFIKFYPYDKLE